MGNEPAVSDAEWDATRRRVDEYRSASLLAAVAVAVPLWGYLASGEGAYMVGCFVLMAVAEGLLWRARVLTRRLGGGRRPRAGADDPGG